jgi:DNA-binding HxlR family transcriptional regulator
VADPASTRRRQAKADARTPAAPAPRARKVADNGAHNLLHDRIRLGIVSALAGTGVLTFVELKTVLDTTDGNLSVHARRLEEAGYVTCTKTFADRRPRSQYQLTPLGRRSLQKYLDHMQALIETTRRNLNR